MAGFQTILSKTLGYYPSFGFLTILRKPGVDAFANSVGIQSGIGKRFFTGTVFDKPVR
jgi:hypothetical protein